MLNILQEENIKNFVQEIEAELKDDILKFWIEHTIDQENGGFYGFVSDDLVIDKTHEKASVLYSRILWTYSTAYRYYKEEKYLAMAERAYNYIVKYFVDKTNSGVYWLLDYKGNVIDSKKQTYAVAFAIYALSEFFRATDKKESLNLAIELFHSLEEHSYDKANRGYVEARTMDWLPLSNMSLSPKDMNVSKSMNTHLHVMEAYTNLMRVWKDDKLSKSLEEVINVTLDHIIHPLTHQFKLFFDEKWNSMSRISSFGHDIEGSWLLYEAAEVLGNAPLLKKVQEISIQMARKTFDRGIDRKNGGLFYEGEAGIIIEDNKQWWPQAEAVVGFANAYQLTKDTSFIEEAIEMWHFIDKHIIDKVHGEWFWGTTVDGSSVTQNEKVGPWKCPYHNSRMCFEILHRFKK
ncbi:MAG: AGE family epimerase/isomerase [Ruminiclostridium sp.]